MHTGAAGAGEIQEGFLNVTVPTGNFGNILAAYYAREMGIPIGKLICASNENKVLFDFFRTGVYDKNRDFVLTISPSMDILVSSNLERLIYRLAGNDVRKNIELMRSLGEKGSYEISQEMLKNLSDFAGGYATEEETKAEIRRMYQETGYVLDPHTAVASSVYQRYRADQKDPAPGLIVSTASPFKFARSVMEAIRPGEEEKDDFALIEELSALSGVRIPKAVEELRSAPVLHKKVIDREEMRQAVLDFLEI